jgi:hypothetical protein
MGVQVHLKALHVSTMVTRLVGEKIAQNVAQTIFVKLNT